jgi:hypothetical protein
MSIATLDHATLLKALQRVLAGKDIAQPDELAERIRITDSGTPAQGARMVAKAWCDPAFRAIMLADGARAAAMLDIPMRGAPPLGVLEDTPDLHHLVVCTLCSCYPRAVLGYPPFWFKSTAYRARAVRDPRGLLAEWGTPLPGSTALRVVDSTADYRWMVLPLRPASTENWTEPQLATLIRASDMIGVTIPTIG